MTPERDTITHATWVATAVNGRRYDVAFEAGAPRAVRRVLDDGEPPAWWKLATLDPTSEYAEAARQAEAFVAEFRGLGA